MALVAAVLTSLTLLQAPPVSAAPVVLQPGELVVNGGAEQPVTVGWTGGLARATHGVSGYPASVIVNSSGATGATYPGGVALFTGTGGASIATQTIDLTPSAAAIDNGNVSALLSAFIGGYANQNDNASLSYNFRDAGGTSLATVAFGPVFAADRGNASGFIGYSQSQLLPAGTRDVVLTITTQRFIAPANDGYVDNISLILDAPNPTANPDSADTDQGVPVTLTPYSNDTPGAGAAIVENTVRLLDGSTEVDSLTTAEGTYEVDTATGEVTFTPVATFFGTTTPVPYRVTDSSGQQDDSTLTITVAFVANPSLSLVKSASPSDPDSYTAGTEVTYSFVVTNTGNILVNDLVINEDAFSGSGELSTPVCPVTSLAPGAQTTCTATYTVTPEDVGEGGVANTASASAVPDGSAVAVDSPPSSFGIPIAAAPAITLAKTASAGASFAGDTVTYSFLVTNTGNVPVSSVSITEDTFSGTGSMTAATCPDTSFLPGQTVTCTAAYELTQADVDAGVVTNTATAAAVPASGGTVDSASSTATVTIAPLGSFTFEKTADRTSISAAGQTVTYTFRFTNTGNVTLSNPVVTETSFSGAGTLGDITCDGSSVAPEGILDCTATYLTVAADLTETTLSNSATATVDDPSENTFESALSTISVPVELPDPVIPAAPGDGLATTGADATGSTVLAAGLLLIGGLLFGLAWALQRRRRALG